MPKYYCDYCDTYLTHDSPSVRKTHYSGRKHKDSVKFYYQKWMEEQAQHLIDSTTAAFKARNNAQNPFGNKGVPIPPHWYPSVLGPPFPTPVGPPAMGLGGPHMTPPMIMGPHGPMPPMMSGSHDPMPQMMMGPRGPMPPMMGMRPPMMTGMVPMEPMPHRRPPLINRPMNE